MSEYSYTIPANTYYAATKEEANAIARAAAEALALAVKFCCEIPDINGCVGEAINESFDVSLGIGPFTWSVTDGTLPAGLAISLTDGGRTMTLSGTPTMTGNATITITITDSNGESIEKTFEIQIIGITTASLPDAQVGVAYNVQLTAAGGSGSYYYELTSGTLPDGLTLSSDGLISGSPTTAGTSNFQISLSDQEHNVLRLITATLNKSLLPVLGTGTSQWNYHSFEIVDFTTIFSSPPAHFDFFCGSKPVFDGNLGVSRGCPGAYVLPVTTPDARNADWSYPNGACGLSMELYAYADDGTVAWGNKPVAFWRLRIYGYNLRAYPPPSDLAWEGVFATTSTNPSGIYTKSGGLMSVGSCEIRATS